MHRVIDVQTRNALSIKSEQIPDDSAAVVVERTRGLAQKLQNFVAICRRRLTKMSINKHGPKTNLQAKSVPELVLFMTRVRKHHTIRVQKVLVSVAWWQIAHSSSTRARLAPGHGNTYFSHLCRTISFRILYYVQNVIFC